MANFEIIVDYSQLDSDSADFLLSVPYEVGLVCPECEGEGELALDSFKCQSCGMCNGTGNMTNLELAHHYQATRRAAIRAMFRTERLNG